MKSRGGERAAGRRREGVKGGEDVEVVESKEVYGHLKERKDNNQRLARRWGEGLEVGRAKSQGNGFCLGEVPVTFVRRQT